MVFEIFTGLVAFLALIYAGMAKFIQSKLVNREEVEDIQKESKKLSEELKEAQKSGNQARIDAAMKKQMEFFPKMNKVMIAQFKPMLIILGLFFAFTWLVGHINPAIADDIVIPMSDDGSGCDAAAGDGTYSACYLLEGTDYGKWTYHVTAYEGDLEMGTNYSYFAYNSDINDTFKEAPKGKPVIVSTGKEEYLAGETVSIYGRSEGATRMEAALDKGTFFSVELPVAIPILNVKTIYQPYWWFILVSLITNLSISIAMKKMGKKK